MKIARRFYQKIKGLKDAVVYDARVFAKRFKELKDWQKRKFWVQIVGIAILTISMIVFILNWFELTPVYSLVALGPAFCGFAIFMDTRNWHPKKRKSKKENH